MEIIIGTTMKDLFLTIFRTRSLIAILLCIFITSTYADTKVALVIGNANYRSIPLVNPKNDAMDMGQALKSLGFEVDVYTDLDRSAMRKAIRVFGDKLKRADTGVFYYAGHGIQISGRNYLVPLKADVNSADEVQDESIDASAILRKMEAAGNNTNIVILDACRNNPFARSFRSLDQGLARMDGPVGSLIAYATSPGSVAADGTGRNGVYTQYLLEALNKPGISIEKTFKWVRNAVREATNGKQTPWESSSLMGEFIFRSNGQKTSNLSITPTAPSISKKYLQVITNVPNARISINQVNRGVTDSKGVLNIENLLDDQVELLVNAEGYGQQNKIVNLMPNQWEQIKIKLIPKVNQKITNRMALSTEMTCMKNKRVMITSKVQYALENGDMNLVRNSPEFMTLLRGALQSYGLAFVRVELSNQKLGNEESYQDAISQAIRRAKAQYLVLFSSSVQETAIKTINTNMKTVAGDMTLEWIDLSNNELMASTTDSFRQAGLNGVSVHRVVVKKNINDLAKHIILQLCK